VTRAPVAQHARRAIVDEPQLADAVSLVQVLLDSHVAVPGARRAHLDDELRRVHHVLRTAWRQVLLCDPDDVGSEHVVFVDLRVER
jgi:hypothetical protein